jgi:RNA polymerase sigma factor (TIGR02999 family)
LVGQKAEYQNRVQFFAVAATMMRRVLIDHARARAAAKRPRPELQIALTPAIAAAAPEALDILGLDRALDELASVDARQARLVELRYFGGLTSEEAAAALGVSLTTAKREWNMAKAWLYRRLSQTAGPSAGS